MRRTAPQTVQWNDFTSGDREWVQSLFLMWGLLFPPARSFLITNPRPLCSVQIEAQVQREQPFVTRVAGFHACPHSSELQEGLCENSWG